MEFSKLLLFISGCVSVQSSQTPSVGGQLSSFFVLFLDLLRGVVQMSVLLHVVNMSKPSDGSFLY